MSDEAPMSPHQILQYATEQLHAVRPQPPADQIALALNTLKASMKAVKPKGAPKAEEAPKDVQEAVGRIMEKVGKMDPAPEEKVDLASCFAKPAEAHEPAPAPAQHKAGKAS